MISVLRCDVRVSRGRLNSDWWPQLLDQLVFRHVTEIVRCLSPVFMSGTQLRKLLEMIRIGREIVNLGRPYEIAGRK